LISGQSIEQHTFSHSAEIARVFAASESGVRRVLQHYRERGTHLPLPRNAGRKLQMTDSIAQQIREFVAARPDATRQPIKDALGLVVSLQAISEWLARPARSAAPRAGAGSGDGRGAKLLRDSRRRRPALALARRF